MKPRDRIRLLRVPALDLEQRERERREGTEMPGWTADTIKRILALDPVATIDRVDAHGSWFSYNLPGTDGATDHHSIMMMEDESWCFEPAVE